VEAGLFPQRLTHAAVTQRANPNGPMPENTKLQELRKNQRLILLHIRRGALIFAMTAAGLLLAQLFSDIRLWIPFAVLGVLSVTVLGDVVRYLYCARQMKKVQQPGLRLCRDGQ
jgi:hypothetical protein